MTPTRSWLLLSMLVPATVATGVACSSSSSTGGNPGTDGGSDSSAADSTAADSGEETAADSSEPETSAEAAVDSATGTDAGHDSGDASKASDGDAGPAQPVAIVSDAPNATMLATDGTSVYWIDSIAGDGGQIGRVMKVAVGGGTETTLASTPGAIPAALALDGTNVYWTASDNSLTQVAKSGGTTTSLQASGVGTPVTASGGFVFFCPQSGGGVSKIAVGSDGGSATVLATSGNPVDLVVVAGDVFWADATGHIAFVPAGAGGTPTDLVTPDPDAGSGEFVSNTAYQNITTDGTSLYWPRGAGSFPGAVMSLPVGGGSPQVVVNIGTDSPMSVAVDNSNAYFLDVTAAMTTSLVFVPLGGGSTSTLATTDVGSANITGVPGPTVAVDSTSVYWLNPPQIAKIAK